MALLSNFGFLAALATLRIRHRSQQRTQAATFRRCYTAREQELTALMSYMQRSAEDEKSRMARGLHDELGGVLTSAKIDVAWIRKAAASNDPDLGPRLERLSKAIDEAVNIERRVVETLRPSLLDHLGLAAALDWYVTESCKTACIDCSHKSFDDAAPVPLDLAIVIYRVVQEAMSDIIDGARADRIEISLERSAQGLHLCLHDNGDPPPGAPSEAQQQRLALMRQRALCLGGTFELERAAGQGTRLRAFFPAATTQ